MPDTRSKGFPTWRSLKHSVTVAGNPRARTWADLVICGEGDGDAVTAEDGSGVAAVGDDDLGLSDEGDDGGGANRITLRSTELAAAVRGLDRVAPFMHFAVHPREASLHRLPPLNLLF